MLHSDLEPEHPPRATSITPQPGLHHVCSCQSRRPSFCPINERPDKEGTEDSGKTAVVFSLKNEVGCLVKALRLFQVRMPRETHLHSDLNPHLSSTLHPFFVSSRRRSTWTWTISSLECPSEFLMRWRSLQTAAAARRSSMSCCSISKTTSTSCPSTRPHTCGVPKPVRARSHAHNTHLDFWVYTVYDTFTSLRQ